MLINIWLLCGAFGLPPRQLDLMYFDIIFKQVVLEHTTLVHSNLAHIIRKLWNSSL